MVLAKGSSLMAPQGMNPDPDPALISQRAETATPAARKRLTPRRIAQVFALAVLLVAL